MENTLVMGEISSVYRIVDKFDLNIKQAGTELGQAQDKLKFG